MEAEIRVFFNSRLGPKHDGDCTSMADAVYWQLGTSQLIGRLGTQFVDGFFHTD